MRQHAAIRFCRSQGFVEVAAFLPYIPDDESVFMELILDPPDSA